MNKALLFIGVIVTVVIIGAGLVLTGAFRGPTASPPSTNVTCDYGGGSGCP